MKPFQPASGGYWLRLLICIVILGAHVLGDPVFDRLAVLNGTWKMETRRGPLFERWTSVDDSTMRGLSYRISSEDTVLLERLELISRPDGVFYIPTVANQNNGNEISFKLISSADDRFVFENKEHDFPQRIIYSVITADSIVARVEGISGGKEASSEFYYRRVSGK